MRFYHVARPEGIEEILETGVIEPRSYPDLSPHETLRLRGQDRPVSEDLLCPDTCPWGPHNRTPVTWMYRVTHWIPMLGPSQPGFMFTLDLPGAHVWQRWARAQGSPQRWVDIHHRLWDYSRMYGENLEYVTTDPIPSDQWVRVMNMQTRREVWPERDESPLPRVW